MTSLESGSSANDLHASDADVGMTSRRTRDSTKRTVTSRQDSNLEKNLKEKKNEELHSQKLARQEREMTSRAVQVDPCAFEMTMSSSKLAQIEGGKVATLSGVARVDDEAFCVDVLERLVTEVKERQKVLERKTTSPPRGNNTTRVRQTRTSEVSKLPVIPPERKSLASSEGSGRLREKIEELASELQLYTYQEKQVTHAHSLARTGALTSNAFKPGSDTLDEQLVLVERSLTLRQGQGQSLEVIELLQQTKRERELCAQMLLNIERSVKKRRMKLVSQNPTLASAELTGSPRVETASDSPYKRSSLGKRLLHVQAEMRLYMQLEGKLLQRRNSSYRDAFRARDDVIKQKKREIRTLQMKVETLTEERERLKAENLTRAHRDNLKQQQQQHRPTNAFTHADTPPRDDVTNPRDSSSASSSTHESVRKAKLTSLKALVRKRKEEQAARPPSV